ncbi:MAG: SDR family oxidoreductase [Acidobacteriota bacterium]|nr:MAG: SDR family oxidoreductase [Acidobacteriota bacterium]
MSDWNDRVALVTGANRGLGLEFARQLVEGGARVFALCRDPRRATDLAALAAGHTDRIAVHAADVADDASVADAFAAVGRATDRLDLVVNNAGVFGPRDQTLETLDFGAVREVFEINVLGALRVVRAALPLLDGPAPRVVQISSLMGSIADNGSGGAWAYRLSKAALNMATRNLGHELIRRGIVTAALHPGWVRTAMGGDGAPLSAGDAVRAMLATIARLGPAESGLFLDREGRPLAW